MAYFTKLIGELINNIPQQGAGASAATIGGGSLGAIALTSGPDEAQQPAGAKMEARIIIVGDVSISGGINFAGVEPATSGADNCLGKCAGECCEGACSCLGDCAPGCCSVS